MKSLLSYLVVATSFTGALAASTIRQALVYTVDLASHDSIEAQSESKDISLDTAKLIIDRRLGTDLKESIGDSASEDLLDVLNRYSGVQRPMLQSSDSHAAKRLGIVLEGWEPGHADSLTITPTLRVEDLESDNLYDQMLSTSRTNSMCSFSRASKSGLRVDVQLMETNCIGLSDVGVFGNDQDMIDATMLERVFQVPFHNTALVRFLFPKHSNRRISELLQTVHDLTASDARRGIQETTIIVHPHSTKTSKKHHLQPRRQPKEEPLTAISAASSPAEIHDSTKPQFAANSTPLPISNTKISHCFSSLSSCQTSTNNCSSHGSCVLLHSPTSGDDSSDPECWSCSCRATSSGNGNGGVIKWGGNACQKKDISTPFWLFAGFGVSMAAAIAGGIGMLYGMGSQELPGVLGAGVGGPRAQR